MNKAYLLIGGNMGDRVDFLEKAKKGIQKDCGTIVQSSSLYQTAAWGLEEQDTFLNQALVVETDLAPAPLLQSILALEETIGRVRELKYGPRVIDIDILFFNEAIEQTPDLTLPHPEVQNRRFALVPLAEIAPNLVHPVFEKTVLQLLAECPDRLDVHKIS